MKFTCNQQILAKALNTVSKAVTVRTTIPILKGISSGFVIIIVTVLVSASAAYFAPIKEEGACDET